MYVLIVDARLKPGQLDAVESRFADSFRPAISAQPGFVQVELLVASGDPDSVVILIAFDAREAQQAWIATDLHQEVWPAMEAHFDRYAVRDFHAAG